MTTDGQRPFYEERWFKGTAAVLGLVAVVFSLVGPPKLWDVIREALSRELPRDNTVYVLDASTAMGVPFGAEGTKLTAAAKTITAVVEGREGVGLALRRFGAACGEPGDLLVDFGDDRAEEIEEAAGKQEAAGEANLVNAVVAAIDDYSDDHRFPPDGGFTKRIVVVTGSADGCFENDAAEQIRRRITQTDVELDFTFVGVAVPEDERERLREVANDLESRVVFADTEEELALVVDYLELEPSIADARAVAEIYNTVRDTLVSFVRAVNGRRFDEAERALGDWEEAVGTTESRFRNFGARAASPEVVAMRDLLGEARVLQNDLLAIGPVLLEAARRLQAGGSEAEYSNAVAEWDGALRRLDDKRVEIQQAIDRLADQLPPLES